MKRAILMLSILMLVVATACQSKEQKMVNEIKKGIVEAQAQCPMVINQDMKVKWIAFEESTKTVVYTIDVTGQSAKVLNASMEDELKREFLPIVLKNSQSREWLENGVNFEVKVCKVTGEVLAEVKISAADLK